MPPPFFFPALLMISGGFTTLYSMSARCCAFLFLGLKSGLCAFAGKGNCMFVWAMLQQSRCRI